MSGGLIAEETILNDFGGTWFTNDVRQKSLKTRVEMCYTCVSCLHCKRLPQTLKHTNVTQLRLLKTLPLS